MVMVKSRNMVCSNSGGDFRVISSRLSGVNSASLCLIRT